ncbi:MAG: hypothetical protein V4574_15415 [Pseudomonadota bacterium]
MKAGAFAVPLAVMLAGCGSSPSDGNVALGGKAGDGAKIEEVKAQASPAAGNGPFGVTKGTPLEQLDKGAERDAETGLAVLSSVPTPSSQFPDVAVISYPETGICEIRAMSREFDNDSYITAATAFADEVAGALESRYGKGKLDNGCSGHACENQYKIQEIESGARWYNYKWESPASKPFENHVKSLTLWVNHTRFNDSQVRLDYVFDNEAACASASKKAKASNL